MRIGILCGGGPAPGFNGVIHAVTMEAASRGFTPIGIPYGYSRLMAGDVTLCHELTADQVAGINVQGGGILFTNRANPKKSPETMQAVVDSVKQLRLDALVTIGGDDTATSAAAIAEAVGGGMRVAHVPKTIDNDLPLPSGMPTFGFETAKQVAGQLCRNLRTDACTTGRWYVVTAMGRSAGHLALGMAMESDADLCIIQEEFQDGPISLDAVSDIVEAGIAKRAAAGQNWGLIVFGEGILERLDPIELKHIAELELDEHGNPRMSEIDLGKAVVKHLEERGTSAKFVTKLIGYELRGADPVPFDVEYTGQLGRAAVQFLAEGEGNGIITVVDGKPNPLRFEDLVDPASGRIPVRRVDVSSAPWTEFLPTQAR